jgi:hypothetical protein
MACLSVCSKFVPEWLKPELHTGYTLYGFFRESETVVMNDVHKGEIGRIASLGFNLYDAPLVYPDPEELSNVAYNFKERIRFMEKASKKNPNLLMDMWIFNHVERFRNMEGYTGVRSKPEFDLEEY